MNECPAGKIVLSNVSKYYKNQKGEILPVLDNINLEIRHGEFICIAGPSGCGKTTLLNIIAGLVKPDKGNVYANGQEITHANHDRALMFQESALFPWLTVRENVEFGLKMCGMKKEERIQIASDYLKLVRLSKFEDSLVHELSGGMKQRVALARSLAINPDILLMDEPFAALDAQTRDNLHLELQQIWAKTKKTILFVTHNVSEAVCLGDRVLVLTYQPGRIKSEFKVELERPRFYRNNPKIAGIASLILDDLKEEITKSVNEELNETKN